MKQYDYFEAVRSDVRKWAKKHVNVSDFESADGLEDYLMEALWSEDSVTGNASGTYTRDARKAEENLCHNWALLSLALERFCHEDPLDMGAELCDAVVRCYLLERAVQDVVAEIYENS